MSVILIFRHEECEGPGYLEDFLNARQRPFAVVAIDQGQSIPDSIDNVAGLVFMGGSMSVNDPLDWIEKEIGLIRLALKKGIPLLGHCLGGQLMAKALGAEVKPNPVPEIGWYPVRKIPGPEADDWLGDSVEPEATVFHWHGETFAIPIGAIPILTSRYCKNQAFVLGNHIALQCHIEMTAAMVQEWTVHHEEQLDKPSASIQTAVEMKHGLSRHSAGMRKLADSIYSRWLRGLQTAG